MWPREPDLRSAPASAEPANRGLDGNEPAMAPNPASTPQTPESVARAFTQLAPLHHPPRRVRPPFDVACDERRNICRIDVDAWQQDRVTALLEALDGLELGAYDRRIIERLAGWEISTVGTIVSLLYRARAAGVSDGA